MPVRWLRWRLLSVHCAWLERLSPQESQRFPGWRPPKGGRAQWSGTLHNAQFGGGGVAELLHRREPVVRVRDDVDHPQVRREDGGVGAGERRVAP